jgi:tartrate dehydratase beta subunit/fumarate hydratase class I family protein
MYRFIVRDFPLVVINDTVGGDLYASGRARYAHSPVGGDRSAL